VLRKMPLVLGFLGGCLLYLGDTAFYASATDITFIQALWTGAPLYRIVLRAALLFLCLLSGFFRANELLSRHKKSWGLVKDFRIPLDMVANENLADNKIMTAAGADKNMEGYDKATKCPAFLDDACGQTKISQSALEQSFWQNVKSFSEEEDEISQNSEWYSSLLASSRESWEKLWRLVLPAKAHEHKPGESSVIPYGPILWQYCGVLATALKLNGERMSNLRTLCYCYNIGCFGVEAHSLAEEKLSPETAHSAVGERVLAGVPELAGAAPLVRYHHERFDGSGLFGLKEDKIPLECRIFTIAWVYHALTRPNGSFALKMEDALETLYQYASTALDPKLVALFIRLLGKDKFYVESGSKDIVWE